VASFCKEICSKQGWTNDVFSISDVFYSLSEDESVMMICEACGFVRIANFDGVCYVGLRKVDPSGRLEASTIEYREFDFLTNKIL